jgi:hypothetical protein
MDSHDLDDLAWLVHQLALAFQVTANPLGEGVRQLGEFIAGGRLDPAKPGTGPVGAVDVNTVQKYHVKVNVQIR